MMHHDVPWFTMHNSQKRLCFRKTYGKTDQISDKETLLEEVVPFLGLCLRNIADIIYPMKFPLGQLMMPPVPQLSQYWTALDEPLEPGHRYMMIFRFGPGGHVRFHGISAPLNSFCRGPGRAVMPKLWVSTAGFTSLGPWHFMIL